MNPIIQTRRRRISARAALVLAVSLVLGAPSAWAATQYLNDGALQNSRGGFDLPAQGTCPAGAANGYTGIDTRPECVALRLNVVQASCVAPNTSWTTAGVCNDLINTTQAACAAAPDRLWNPGSGVCSIVMLYDDRNDVTCALHGGAYLTTGTCTGAWVMPARTAYNPPLLTGNSPGDQCLRCHNSRTQYNNPRVRDTEDTLYMGHKNMSRKVTPGTPWGGPAFACSLPLYTTEESCFDNGGTWDPTVYPSDDSGNLFNWNTGRVTVNGTDYDLTWIYADWIAPRPRAIYKTDPSTSQVCSDPRGTTANCIATYGGTLINNAGAAYSCARCHTTGWTSDASIQDGTAGQLLKEPEKSFPGLTWDRNSNAGFGKVNLSGGVSGDPRKYSSWDNFGITCTRCHSSAIDTTKGDASTPTQYGAPTGMSSHHSNMTTPDAGGGVCTDSRWTAEAQCTAAGGSWLTGCSTNPTPAICQLTAANSAACGTAGGTWTDAPFCSSAFYTDSANCTSNGFSWTLGWCAGAAPTGSPLACATGTLRPNGTQQSCQVALGTWSFSKCDIEGVCNKGPAYTTLAACTTAGGQFRYATDIIRCDDAGGRWTGSNSNRGPIITRLCMDCHRQETAGLPYDATSTDGVAVDYSATDPAGKLKVGQYHSTIAFLSHPHGNQFLNSPHGKFNGRFNQIATGRFNYAMTGEYKSFFQTDGEAANTGNGCTGCHEVHTSTVAGEEPFREECTDCHAGQYKKDLTRINHLWGKGTPMENAATDESGACVSCHMPGGMHLWRINSDASYSTFPVAAALATTGALNANTAPEGTYNAAWVDVNAACGQCHGGGTSYVQTTGSITPPSAVVTVASATGFLVGERIRIADAGSYEYDDQGSDRGDFDSYIKAVNTGTNQITLVGAPPIAASGKTVTQNPRSLVEPGRLAPYYSKAQLALVAKGMHGSSGTNYAVTFSTAIDPGNSLKVNVDADVNCGGTCPTLTYDWNWGDNTTHGILDPDSHTYAAAGKYAITLIVKSGGLQVGALVTRGVNVVAPNQAPVAAGTCNWNGDTWTMVVTDTSFDPDDADPANLQVLVDWGDLGAKSSVPRTGPRVVTKVYTRIGSFPVTQKAIDIHGLSSTNLCGTATPAYFVIGGTVKTSLSAGIPGAVVTLKRGVTNIASALTAANGAYTFPNLKPATYSITVTKAGYGFGGAPQLSVTVGGSRTNADVTAITTPLGVVSPKSEGMDNAN